MSEASTSSQTAPTANPQQEPKTIYVSRASARHNRILADCDLAEVIEQIRTGSGGVSAKVARIREKFWQVMDATSGHRQAAKDAVDELKLALPAVTPSGTFTRRSDKALSKPSGFICIDIDGLGREKLAEVKAKLRESLFLYALFDSPTEDGVKAFFRVPADGDKHLAVFRALRKHVLEIAGVEIDESCKNVGRLCYLSYDPDVYVNEKAVEIPLLPEPEEPPRRQRGEQFSADDPRLETRRTIAKELLGDIDWYSETQGYITCPGEEDHQTRTEDTHCRVHLDGAPNIFCFHNSCAKAREEVNRQLQSRIAEAERYPRNDTERALRFVEHFGDDLWYVEAWDQWLVWDGTRWVRDSQGAVFRRAQQMSNILLQSATAIEDYEQRKKAAGAAIAAGNESKIKAMLNVARYDARIEASPESFDSNPHLIGVLME